MEGLNVYIAKLQETVEVVKVAHKFVIGTPEEHSSGVEQRLAANKTWPK